MPPLAAALARKRFALARKRFALARTRAKRYSRIR